MGRGGKGQRRIVRSKARKEGQGEERELTLS